MTDLLYLACLSVGCVFGSIFTYLLCLKLSSTFEAAIAEYSKPVPGILNGIAMGAATELVVKAARRMSQILDGGFVRCSNCGEQEDTTDLDFAPELRQALEVYDTHAFPSNETREALEKCGGEDAVNAIIAEMITEGQRVINDPRRSHFIRTISMSLFYDGCVSIVPFEGQVQNIRTGARA